MCECVCVLYVALCACVCMHVCMRLCAASENDCKVHLQLCCLKWLFVLTRTWLLQISFVHFNEQYYNLCHGQRFTNRISFYCMWMLYDTAPWQHNPGLTSVLQQACISQVSPSLSALSQHHIFLQVVCSVTN